MLDKLKKNLIPIIVGLVLVVGAVLMFSGGSNTTQNTIGASTVKVPVLSAMAKEGAALYNESCAVCHGANTQGTDSGPTFMSSIYHPGHHGDEAFFRAAQFGVRAHHWGFGNMPAILTVNRVELTKIIRYVRELQVANGIATEEDLMR